MKITFTKKHKELAFIFNKFFIQCLILKKIGISFIIGNDGLQLMFLCFYIGLTPRNNIF